MQGQQQQPGMQNPYQQGGYGQAQGGYGGYGTNTGAQQFGAATAAAPAGGATAAPAGGAAAAPKPAAGLFRKHKLEKTKKEHHKKSKHHHNDDE